MLAITAGATAAIAPAYLVGVLVLGAVIIALTLASISLRAGALALIAFGHLVSGTFYVAGQIPTSFSLGLDLLVLLLFAAALPRILQHGDAAATVGLAFLAIAALQILNPLIPSLSYGISGFRQLALPIAMALAVRELSLSSRELRLVVIALLGGWSFSLALALYQWLGQFSAAEIAWASASSASYLVDGQMRLMGASQSNQDFAFFAAVALPAVAVLAYTTRHAAVRALTTLLLVLSLAVLVGSLVRSGLIGGVIGMATGVAAAAVTGRDARRLLALGLAVSIIIWGAVQVLPDRLLGQQQIDTLQTRVTSIFTPSQDFAFRQRQESAWPQALHVIASHPLGAGAGAAGPVSQRYETKAPFGALVPDNGYLLIAVQTGLIGLTLFVAFLALALRDLIKGARAGGTFAAAAIGAGVAIMVAMVAGNYWQLTAPGTVLGVLLGLGLRDTTRTRGR